MKKTTKFLLILFFLPLMICAQGRITFFEPPLVSDQENPIALIQGKISTPLTSITLTFDQTKAMEAIDSFFLYPSDSKGNPKTDSPLTSTAIEQLANNQIKLNWETPFQGSLRFLLLTLTFKKKIDLTTTFQIVKINEISVQTPLYRVGYRLRKSGDDGSLCYRIPGLVASKKGSLIAVYDVRWNGAVDLPNPIDIGMSRSTDGGKSWESMKIIMDMGDDPQYKGEGIGDPAILVDEETGRIWVAATWSHGDRAWWGSQKGLSPNETGQLMLTYSDDDGITWSQPINITAQVKDPDWHYLLQGPGIGITMQDGTLVFAAQYQDESKERVPYSTILFSKDKGKSWNIVKGPRSHTTESQVIELEKGTLMLNCRDDRNRIGERRRTGGRAIYITKDMGKSWEKHPSSDFSLPEPNCQASLIRINPKQIAFFNPNSHLLVGADGKEGGRRNFTLQISEDEGLSWHKKWKLDDGKGRGYSSMAVEGNYLHILYEGSKSDLFYQKIALDELLR